MCEVQYTKTKQELEAIKVAKSVIAKVFQTYANPASPAQKTAVSTIDELIAKCSTEVTEEVSNGHLSYDLAIHTMTAIKMVLTGRTTEFVIPRDSVVFANEVNEEEK